MPEIKLRVRGIYATALTALLLERFEVVDPSEAIQTRLGLTPREEPPEVNVYDRADRHGVVVEGLRSAAAEVVAFLKARIPWAVFVEKAFPRLKHKESPLAGAWNLLARFEGEFPKPAKDFLDGVRSTLVFTIPDHHLLKTIDPVRVDEVEAQHCLELAYDLKKELIWSGYVPGRALVIVHGKAGEEPIRQSGELWEVEKGRVVIRRTFRAGGLFEGLGVPKLPGDYGFVEIYPDQWWSKRTYFRADGTPLGELYNIQTPPEFLRQEIRYLDLELDLVRTGEGLRLIDEEVLNKKVEEGLISPALADKAREESQRLWQALSRAQPADS